MSCATTCWRMRSSVRSPTWWSTPSGSSSNSTPARIRSPRSPPTRCFRTGSPSCHAGKRSARLVHFSTDCVFAGRAGPFSESSSADAEDLYGRSKLLGEVKAPGCLTIRSSIVGRELRGRSSLIEWFLAQRRGKATGYAGALYTGLTTNVRSDLFVARLVTDYPDLDGIWHVASEPTTSKYELLKLVNQRSEARHRAGVRRQVTVIDRRLDGSRAFERAPASWLRAGMQNTIAEMRADPTPYDS